MSKSTGTSTNYCPCGRKSIGIFRGEKCCERCKRIEQRFDEYRPASSFFRLPTAEEITARLARYTEDQWAAESLVDLTPVPPPPVPEGKILISGYAHYVL